MEPRSTVKSGLVSRRQDKRTQVLERVATRAMIRPPSGDASMPLSLTDDEYAAVQAAAAPIRPLERGAFLQALAKELEQHPVVGPGLVHRLAADLQRRFSVEAQRVAPMPESPWTDEPGRARA